MRLIDVCLMDDVRLENNRGDEKREERAVRIWHSVGDDRAKRNLDCQ